MATKTIAGMFEKNELAQVIRVLTGQLAECKDNDLIQVRITVSKDDDSNRERLSIGQHALNSGHGLVNHNGYIRKDV